MSSISYSLYSPNIAVRDQYISDMGVKCRIAHTLILVQSPLLFHFMFSQYQLIHIILTLLLYPINNLMLVMFIKIKFKLKCKF